VIAGAVLQWRTPIDIKPLATLQIRILVPAFLLVRLTESSLNWSDLSRVALGIALIKLGMALVIFVIAKVAKLSQSTTFVLLVTTCVFNAGNFGIPVAERTFGTNGAAVEAVVVLMSNFSLWGIGYALMSARSSSGLSWLKQYFSLPMPYAFLLAMFLKLTGIRVPEPIWSPISWCANAVIPVALLTLGIQLAKQARLPSLKFISVVVTGKLILMPIIAALVCWLFGYWPWPAGQMILAAASPSAVNAVLLAIDQKADVERTTDAVFWTTAVSSVTVPIVIWLLYAFGGNALPRP
jgi:predicted permease